MFGLTQHSTSPTYQKQYGNFEIGAYQVCEKWLKERDGTTLSDVEIRQYQQILVAVAETIHIMEVVDVKNDV